MHAVHTVHTVHTVQWSDGERVRRGRRNILSERERKVLMEELARSRRELETELNRCAREGGKGFREGGREQAGSRQGGREAGKRAGRRAGKRGAETDLIPDPRLCRP